MALAWLTDRRGVAVWTPQLRSGFTCHNHKPHCKVKANPTSYYNQPRSIRATTLAALSASFTPN